MIDLFIEIPPEFCYGVVESVTENGVILTKDSWAPGIWAGCGKFWIEIRDNNYGLIGEALILGYNLETREITLGFGQSGVCQGDKLYRSIK